MPRRCIVPIPSSILSRLDVEQQASKPTLEGLPGELLLETLRYTDLFTRINIARCSTRLAAFVYTWRLLHLDPRHLSASDRSLLLDSIPIEMRLAEHTRVYTNTPDDRYEYFLVSGSSPPLFFRINIHPARLHCKVYNFRRLIRDSISSPAFRTAYVSHVRIEFLRAGGQLPMPEPMIPPIVRSLRLLRRITCGSCGELHSCISECQDWHSLRAEVLGTSNRHRSLE